MTEKQKTSPFLKEKQAVVSEKKPDFQKSRPEMEPKVKKIEREKHFSAPPKSPSSPKPKMDQPKKEKPVAVPMPVSPNIPNKRVVSQEPKSNKNFLLAALFLIIALAIGGLSFYYYKNIRQGSEIEVSTEVSEQVQEQEASENEVVVENNITDDQIEEALPGQEETAEVFSLEKPNFLILDENFQAKEVLKQYAKKIVEQSDKSLIEFIPVNVDYEPVTLEGFFGALNTPLYSEISSSLNMEKDFSLFFYNDDQGARLGIVIPLSEGNISIEKYESQLASDFNSLLLDETKKETSTSFEKTTHKDILLSYTNFEEKGALSLDYFVASNNLVLATSKNISLDLVDLLISQGE